MPSRYDWNTRPRPSGDQEGSVASCRSPVSLRARPPVAGSTQIAVTRSIAKRVPSGDSAAEVLVPSRSTTPPRPPGSVCAAAATREPAPATPSPAAA
ncbi:hypothetical protein GCM10010185_60940 [Saccharothrix coeruleofusca]|uniref:Uncharacterized protein n=1 Tax=Saccharothrix coeruleofusca TaxID=33919 RepID=A0A918AUK4_9PSEU|nr:hypothetical protein GCM10010185_60940 [Saccharothrix coeruleofusca]